MLVLAGVVLVVFVGVVPVLAGVVLVVFVVVVLDLAEVVLVVFVGVAPLAFSAAGTRATGAGGGAVVLAWPAPSPAAATAVVTVASSAPFTVTLETTVLVFPSPMERSTTVSDIRSLARKPATPRLIASHTPQNPVNHFLRSSIVPRSSQPPASQC